MYFTDPLIALDSAGIKHKACSARNVSFHSYRDGMSGFRGWGPNSPGKSQSCRVP